MSTSGPRADARIVRVHTDDHSLTVDPADGRRLSVPLAWSQRLLQATREQRRNCRLIGDGEGIHRPELDEDLSVEGLLRGPGGADGSRRAS